MARALRSPKAPPLAPEHDGCKKGTGLARFVLEPAVSPLALALGLMLVLVGSGCGGLAQAPGAASQILTPQPAPTPPRALATVVDTPTPGLPAATGVVDTPTPGLRAGPALIETPTPGLPAAPAVVETPTPGLPATALPVTALPATALPATASATPTPTPPPPTPTPVARLPLSIRAELDPSTPRAGEEFVVALSITDNGGRPARGIYVATTGPWDRWTVLQVEPSGTFARDATGWHIVSPIEIQPDETRTLEVHVRADEATEEQLTFAVREAEPSELP